MNDYRKQREAEEDAHIHNVPDALKKIVRAKAPTLSLTPSNVITETLPSCMTTKAKIRVQLAEMTIDNTAFIEGIRVVCRKYRRQVVYDIDGYGQNWLLDDAAGAIAALSETTDSATATESGVSEE